jgi:alkylhydroperoxidase family enzyme
MTDATQLRKALVERILDGGGAASNSQRRAGFENARLAEPLGTLIQKIATQATAVTDHDIEAARASGLTEDQIFEIVVCAAVGQSTRQYESARAALELVTQKE